ncbi:MAG: CAP domain-containing protein [Pseudomonadota bacterium]
MKTTHLLLAAGLCVLGSSGFFCAPKRLPASSVELRHKLDKKIVALSVNLRDHRLAEVAQGIALGELKDDVAIAEKMATQGVPYAQWVVYRSEGGDLDVLLKELRRLSPASCGLVDLPTETAICARAVVEFNSVPVSGSEGGSHRVQGTAQGTARIEELLVMAPGGEFYPATMTKSERTFDATFATDRGAGLYTIEVLARTGRGIEPAARWWLRVGSASLPQATTGTPEPAETKETELVKQAFERLNQDRAAVQASPISWSAKLAEVANQRAKDYASVGALSPPDQEKLAKLLIEGNRALSRYSETIVDGVAMGSLFGEINQSPSRRRTHLDPVLTSGAVGVARSADGRIFLVEVLGRSYDPENPNQLREAIVDRINLARSRQGAAPLTVHKPLTAYAAKIADWCMKRNTFFEKDEMQRTLSDAILGDITGLQYAGSEMFKVSGAEEVTPGATPIDRRFTLVGVGAARKKGDQWWVVILVAAAEPPK